MNTTDIIPWIRKEATLSSLSTEYTPTVLLQMMNHTMREVFEPIVASTRSGYWLHTFQRTLGVNNNQVRLPGRATPAIEQVDVSLNGTDWAPLTEALESETQEWMLEYGRSQHPVAYTLRGDWITLYPAAKVENVQLRVKVCVRPSVLVEAQSHGRIIAVDTDTRILTVNSLPQSMPSAVAIAGSNVELDAIIPRGNFELSLCSVIGAVLSSTTVQIDAGYSVQRVEVGDYLRVANQSEWPQLPESFHKLVGSITAIPVCTQRDLHERSGELSTQCSNALGRLNEHLRPRIRAQQHKPLQHNWT